MADKANQTPPPYVANDGNIAGLNPLDPVDTRFIPDFMGMSGQGNNQNTNRPQGSV